MDKETFGGLIIDNSDSFYRIARSILANDEDCADAIGEAIAKSFEKLSHLKKDEFARTWFIRILINECYNIHRKSQWFVPQGENEEDLLDNIEASYGNVGDDEYAELHMAIDMLDNKQRLIITLYYIEGYDTGEIARMIHMTGGNVKVNLSRARKKIRKFLEECRYE